MALQPSGPGVSGTVGSESALRSPENLLSRVRAPPPAPWPDGGPESLKTSCCGLALYENLKQPWQVHENQPLYQ
ncbi:hypothetical protein PoB_003543700 [Plakobranchus ocellatus]|uniref:Uncharacterized protein n=1 Tax=Plakobranchus ocellatus TaxID=259542 RepID=A0AAV4ANT6_9GAST|nr:hypothetical protein PoB_003543700 [Plakobranchus ocellatus]